MENKTNWLLWLIALLVFINIIIGFAILSGFSPFYRALSSLSDQVSVLSDDFQFAPKPKADIGISGPAPVCGDGSVNQVSEECDDGDTDTPITENPFDNDGICVIGTNLPYCVFDTCGNGYLCSNEACTSGPDNGPEECDDDNTISGDGCSSECELEEPLCALTDYEVIGCSGCDGPPECCPTPQPGATCPPTTGDRCWVCGDCTPDEPGGEFCMEIFIPL